MPSDGRGAGPGPRQSRLRKGFENVSSAVAIKSVPPRLRRDRACSRSRRQGRRRVSAVQHRAASARSGSPGASAHHAGGRRVHPRSAGGDGRGEPAGHPRQTAGRQVPPIPAPRHRGASVPAHVRAGRRDGRAGGGFEERTVGDRPRAPGTRARDQDDRHRRARVTDRSIFRKSGYRLSEKKMRPRMNNKGLDRSMQGKESRAMTNELRMSPEALADLGGGKIAYIKAIRSEDVPNLFPQAPEIQPGMQLFALHAADGTPIMLTDSREAAIANAWSQELETVSVH